MVRISKKRARQLAVMGQLLDAERPRDLIDVVKRLGFLQMDPTAVVARTEHLVLWSRMGEAFRPDDLATALYEDRALFEHRAFIFPTSDYSLHRAAMGDWPQGDSSWPRTVREWLDANKSFRRYVLSQLNARGPLRSRDLEDRSEVSWRSSGWTHERNVGMMLEFLWARGEVAVSHRKGTQRVWDLSERVLPVGSPPIESSKAKKELAKRRLRALGIVRAKRNEARGVPVEVSGVDGEWIADPELLDRKFEGRSALVSPFDRLVYDRQRLRDLFEFDYKLEIYVPPTKRVWGYYVLPVLRRDRLVAKVDAKANSKQKVLEVAALHAEPGAKPADIKAVERELNRLARWLGLDDVRIIRTIRTFPGLA